MKLTRAPVSGTGRWAVGAVGAVGAPARALHRAIFPTKADVGSLPRDAKGQAVGGCS